MEAWLSARVWLWLCSSCSGGGHRLAEYTTIDSLPLGVNNTEDCCGN